MAAVYVGHEQDRMRRRMLEEYLLEVRTTHGQHQLVRLEHFAASRNRHVHHFLVLLQIVEAFAHVAVEVVPGQQVLYTYIENENRG